MKKLVLAMACVLSLGLLASCKQGTQDVNLKNQAATESNDYLGKASFTASLQKRETSDTTTGAKKWVADDTKKSLSYSEHQGWASVSWGASRDKVEGNYKSYTLNIPYVYDSDTNTGANNVSDLEYGTITLYIYKIGDKYYTNSANYSPDTTNATRAEVKFSKGNPESSEFTIDSIGVYYAKSNYWTISNITFKRD